MFGRDRKPTQLITALNFHSLRPAGLSALTCQTCSASFQIAFLTSVLNCIRSRRPKLSATQRIYFMFSSRGQKL